MSPLNEAALAPAEDAPAQQPAPVAVEGPVCPNCLTPVDDRFCAHCGQKQGPLEVSVWHFLAEAIDELFSLDAKLMRTLGPLLVRPGKLTADYFAGRRERYVRPFRLYLTCSVALFLVLGLTAPLRKQASRHAMAEGYREAHPGAPIPADPAYKLDELITREVAKAPPGLRPHLERFTRGGISEITARLDDINRDWGPRVNLITPPFLALMVFLLFRGRRPHYVDHFIFCLHFYAFTCLLGIGIAVPPLLLLKPWVIALTSVAIEAVALVYLVLAIRRAYATRWFRTVASALVLVVTGWMIGTLATVAADAIVILRY